MNEIYVHFISLIASSSGMNGVSMSPDHHVSSNKCIVHNDAASKSLKTSTKESSCGHGFFRLCKTSRDLPNTRFLEASAGSTVSRAKAGNGANTALDKMSCAWTRAARRTHSQSKPPYRVLL